MGSLTWHGWQTSLKNAHGAAGIIYGGNLRQRRGEEADKKSVQAKDDEQKETHAPRHARRPASRSRKREPDKED